MMLRDRIWVVITLKLSQYNTNLNYLVKSIQYQFKVKYLVKLKRLKKRLTNILT